jgi:hypothetical protein
LFHRAIASGSISSSRFVVSLAIQATWGGPAPITNQINEVRVTSCAAAPASQSSTEQGAIPRLLKTTLKCFASSFSGWLSFRSMVINIAQTRPRRAS